MCTSRVTIAGAFLTIGMMPSLGRVILNSFRRRAGETTGAGRGAAGRERPKRRFGRLEARNVGSLPPVFVVSPLLLPGSTPRYPAEDPGDALPQGEDAGTGERAECRDCLLHRFSPVSDAGSMVLRICVSK